MTEPAFTARIEVVAADEVRAATLVEGVAADDDEFVTTSRQGRRIVIEIQAPDIGSLRRAVDDALATLGVSEDVLQAGRMDG